MPPCDIMNRNGKIGLVAAVTVILPLSYYLYTKYYSKFSAKDAVSSSSLTESKCKRKVVILYGTSTGTARTLASKLLQTLLALDNCFSSENVVLKDLQNYDEDTLFEKEDIVILLCSTWSEGRPPEHAQRFFEWLRDYRYDFRVSKAAFEKIIFASFGLGGAIYGHNFCKPVYEFHECLSALGATAILEPV